ncbi:MAG: DUF3299 domain-containing protein [Candidatus Hydrogenedentota bacterium]
MKRRTKRDLTIFFGAIVIIVVVALLNGQLSRQGMAQEFEALLLTLEAERIEKGDIVLEWKHMRKTKGSLRKGGTFCEHLLEKDGIHVNLIGFQVAQAQFRNITNFLMLPIPLECYFCSMPPPRDVMFIQMAEGETTWIHNEPVILNGTLQVNQGPGQKFFYQIIDARMGVSLDGGPLTKKRLQLQHMIGGSEHPDAEEGLIDASDAERVSESLNQE